MIYFLYDLYFIASAIVNEEHTYIHTLLKSLDEGRLYRELLIFCDAEFYFKRATIFELFYNLGF